MSLQSREDLIAKLQNKKFRDGLVSSRISNTLALQIRAMRQERGWSQGYLAELLGTSQNAIYRLESPQYGKPSVTTLKRLASIFDVGLAVWFVPFSKLVDRVTQLETEDILVPSFEEDPGIDEEVVASPQVQITADSSQNPIELPRVTTIDLGDITIRILGGVEETLQHNRLPFQAVESTDATSIGELKDGGRAAAA